MKFVRYWESDGVAAIGVINEAGSGVIGLPASVLASDDMIDLIAAGPKAVLAASEYVRAAAAIPLSEITLGAPLHQPRRNIFCVGKNYKAHAEEFHNSGFDSSAGAAAQPDYPIIFTKAPSSVIGPNGPIPGYLDDTNSTDYEGELAVVIGTGGRGISAADAMDHVFGYTIINDVTARDLQQLHRQWFIGKSIDGFCPMGPCLVTRESVDLHALRLRTYVDGELRQDASIADLIFDVPTLIETISRRITLQPGDIIATGTPEGVGIGFTPPKFLKAGNIVRVEIDGIGILENTIAGA